jgi:hypothetical protein
MCTGPKTPTVAPLRYATTFLAVVNLLSNGPEKTGLHHAIPCI